jgi:MoaA/NifB/PqqE/SkfB family radical SAM enzyme
MSERRAKQERFGRGIPPPGNRTLNLLNGSDQLDGGGDRPAQPDQHDSYQNYAIAEFPDFIVIDTTYKCNVVCGMCHLASKDFKIPANPHISMDLIERLIPLLKKSRSVFLLGRGEPLMHPRIYDIIALIRQHCPWIAITFVSNGVLLTKRNIAKLLDLRLDRIHISVDGPDIERGHPQFEKVKANLRDLAEQKRLRNIDYPALHFNYVIGKDNAQALMPTLQFGIEVGLESISIEPLRIIEPMPKWDNYIRENIIYQHLDTVIPLVDAVRSLAAEHGIEIDTVVPTRLNLAELKVTFEANRRHRPTPPHGDHNLPVYRAPSSLKCDRPFKMMRVEMDGATYMCPAALPAGLNALTTDPIEIWNSARFREVRCRLTEEKFDEVCLDCHKLRNKLIFDAELVRTSLKPDKLALSGAGLISPAHKLLSDDRTIQGAVERCTVAGGRIRIEGWAVDLRAERPCLFVVAFIHGRNEAVAQPIQRRPDVAATLALESTEMCGFSVQIDGFYGLHQNDIELWAIDRSCSSACRLPRLKSPAFGAAVQDLQSA